MYRSSEQFPGRNMLSLSLFFYYLWQVALSHGATTVTSQTIFTCEHAQLIKLLMLIGHKNLWILTPQHRRSLQSPQLWGGQSQYQTRCDALFCRTLWCHTAGDLWPFGYWLSSLHYLIFWVVICEWVLGSRPKKCACEVTVSLTADHQNLSRSSIESKWTFEQNSKEFS